MHLPAVTEMYRVNDLYPSIQGEGCLTGVPMTIVRLHGCGVGCPWCDTKETWRARPEDRREALADALGRSPLWAEADAAALAASVAAFPPRWALVTGGEPAEQDLRPLADALHARGLHAALETSGTAGGCLGAPFDWVTVSPKADMPGGRPVLADVVAMADEVKQVVTGESDVAALEALLIAAPPKAGCVVCLQPVSRSSKATALCVTACSERGWRLSVQVHTYLGLP